MTVALRIIRAGPACTLQDAGRRGNGGAGGAEPAASRRPPRRGGSQSRRIQAQPQHGSPAQRRPPDVGHHPRCRKRHPHPTLGIQRSIRHFGFPDFTLDWLVNTKTAIYAIGLAGIWHSAGLVMAIMLADLRGIDQELWKAAKIDGIPMWRTYWSIIIPALRATIITASVLLAIGVIQVYDLVVATTDGGPGTATDVPAKYVMDHLFMRQNIAQAAAMATVMLVTVLAAASPLVYAKHFRRKSEGK